MQLFVGAVCLALTVVVSAVEVSPVFDYHRRVGIPAASQIRRSEILKIVGGYVTDVSETPYQAGIVVQILSFFTSVCGGTLISSTRLLTAAHCQDDGVFSAQLFTVVLGSNTLFSGGLRIATSDVVVHPNWQPATIANDIAVIRASGITFSESIQPISLPQGNEIVNDFVGWPAVASGFGITVTGGTITDNQAISSVAVPVISNNVCSQSYPGYVRASNICTSGAGGRGTCSGDSGGPLVVDTQDRKIVIGITSFGSSLGCEAGYPSAFSRISSYINWIQAQ